LLHEEIKEAVNDSGITDPHQRITEWQKVLTAKCNSLPPEDMVKYGVIAEQWTKDGPPLEVKRRLVFYA